MKFVGQSLTFGSYGVLLANPYVEYYTVPSGGVSAGTQITIPNSRTYTTGTSMLMVFRDGVKQEPGSDYTETSSTTVSFTYDLPSGSRITFLIFRSAA